VPSESTPCVALLIAQAVLWSLVILLVASCAIWVPILINLRVDSSVPWFPVVVLPIGFIILKRSDRWYQAMPVVRPVSMWLCLPISLALAGLSLSLSGVDALQAGRLRLPGDADIAPGMFRAVESLTLLASAGLLEEAAIRGRVQLALQSVIRPVWAEVIAAIEFLLIHGSRLTERSELPLVLLLGIVNGRITTLTRNPRYAALIHCAVNIGAALTVLYFRYEAVSSPLR
jgi:membrane protease YdiL (CAAX protease family)